MACNSQVVLLSICRERETEKTIAHKERVNYSSVLFIHLFSSKLIGKREESVARRQGLSDKGLRTW